MRARCAGMLAFIVLSWTGEGLGAPVVNEFGARPAAGEGEWIEIANAGSDPLSLAGWSIRDATGRGHRLPPGTGVEPGGFLVLAARPESLRVRYHLPDSIAVVSPEGWPVLNDHDAGPGLPADVIVLADLAGATRDSVAYFETWLSPSPGRSLERVDPGAPGDRPASWGWSLDPSGATPGRGNSLSGGGTAGDLVWMGPAEVSPRRDSGVFHYQLPGPGLLGIRLLDANGREVAILQEPEESPARGRWVWGPGLAGPSRPGLYLLCLRWEGQEGRVRRCRPVWVEP